MYSILYGDYPRQKHVAIAHTQLSHVYLAEALQSSRIDGLEEYSNESSKSIQQTETPVLKQSDSFPTAREMKLRVHTKKLYAKVEDHCQTALQIQQRIHGSGR